MPELPEVETVRRGLEPVLVGKQIAKTTVRRAGLRWPFPVDMADRLSGVVVLHLKRRSKYLLVGLSSDETLIIHLGMSGRLLITPKAAKIEKHDHVLFDMESGTRVTFNDTRRFGAMDITATQDLDQHKFLKSLGPEPLGNEFNTDYFAARLNARKTPIKSALLDQRIVAGLGNIYVCEALWRAGISPLRLAGTLSPEEIAILVPHIRETLQDAIEAGGSSLRDYRQADGELGYFQHSFKTYGQEGVACARDACDGVIARITQSGRSSFYCPHCQN